MSYTAAMLILFRHDYRIASRLAARLIADGAHDNYLAQQGAYVSGASA